jgi:DEAD/DEAH box helicase domain-containing protein
MRANLFIEHLQSLPWYQGQVCHVEHIPAREARYGNLARPLPGPLLEALEAEGISELYAHQAAAISAVREGHHVAVITSTASGKTLCYNLPVLESLYGDPAGRALYLFPTKALAQDQMRNLGELMGSAGLDLVCGTYDGDTPRAARGRIRKTASILLTNPDMLHMGILPNHRLWAQFLRHLRFVVVDEAHAYRGVFGSHVACVLRRLRRLCRRYGSEPVFVCCSATIANPAEHVANLTGLLPVVVADDGSPRGSRDFVLWDPPLVDERKSARRSANVEASHLFAELVRQGLRNITFTKARKVAELILHYSREMLAKEDPDLVPLVRSYRAGYLPRERREIEQALFQGKLLGVTATTALELGVDIGALDATVLVGYPGTVASTWQQAGRSGRGARDSISFLIGLDNPLDQYFMRHPEHLFGSSPENALLDADNTYVLRGHLACAAYEMPLSNEDMDVFGSRFAEAVRGLVESGQLRPRGARWYYPSRDYPAERVSIRAASSETYLLVDESEGSNLLEEIDSATAFRRIHPGAVYLHQGECFVVSELDLRRRVARARPVEADYYTQPREISELSVVRCWREEQVGRAQACYGEVEVTEQVIGYRRKQLFSDSVLGEEDLDLPPRSFETTALWFDVPPVARERVNREELDFQGGLHAVEHAAIGILPLFAMCDRQDIGGLSTPHHADTGKAQIFIYDGFPGGVGITEKGFELLPELWEATLRTIAECPCEAGCPSCIHSPKCGNNNEPLDKAAAVVILRALLGAESRANAPADGAACVGRTPHRPSGELIRSR